MLLPCNIRPIIKVVSIWKALSISKSYMCTLSLHNWRVIFISSSHSLHGLIGLVKATPYHGWLICKARKRKGLILTPKILLWLGNKYFKLFCSFLHHSIVSGLFHLLLWLDWENDICWFVYLCLVVFFGPNYTTFCATRNEVIVHFVFISINTCCFLVGSCLISIISSLNLHSFFHICFLLPVIASSTNLGFFLAVVTSFLFDFSFLTHNFVTYGS